MYTHLLFDLDGTLSDPKAGIFASIAYALAELGRPCPPETRLADYIGPPLLQSFAEMLDLPEEHELVSEALRLYRVRYKERGMFENSLYEGVGELLAELKDMGLLLFIATAKPLAFTRPIMEHFGLAHLFTGIYGPGLDGHLSDKADLIGHIVKTEGLDVSRALMTGDRRFDFLAARANGMACYGVSYGYGAREELALADACFNTVGELGKALKAAAAGSSPAIST